MLSWYGWTARASVHFIVPIIGSSFFGLGVMLSFLAIQLYLVDTFTYAASAIAAASFLRSFFGFVFPLFARAFIFRCRNRRRLTLYRRANVQCVGDGSGMQPACRHLDHRWDPVPDLPLLPWRADARS